MPEAPWFLHHFDLDTSASERDIKRAYARKLKTFDAGLDAAQFDTLRQAYQQALGWADMKANNPELAQVIWGGESLTPEVADAQPDIAPVDSAAEPAQAVQLETVSTGFDVPADAPWSARAELDSLFSALNVSLNPIK
jgi:protein TonB